MSLICSAEFPVILYNYFFMLSCACSFQQIVEQEKPVLFRGTHSKLIYFFLPFTIIIIISGRTRSVGLVDSQNS